MGNLVAADVIHSADGVINDSCPVLFHGSVDEAMSYAWDQSDLLRPFIYIRIGVYILNPDEIAALRGP